MTATTNPDFSALSARANANFLANKPVVPVAKPIAPISIKQEDIFGNLKKQLD